MWENMWRTTGWRRAMEEAAGKSNEDPRVKKRYSLAEQILAEATTPEKLQGNPFKGKPLYLDRTDPFEKDHALANRMLKSAGYKPPWIETREEILAEKRALREEMARHLTMLEAAVTAGKRERAGSDPGTEAEAGSGVQAELRPRSSISAVKGTRTAKRADAPSGSDVGAAPGLAELRARHAAFLESLKERIGKLRRQIIRFNLEVPIVDQQVVNVNYDTFTQEMRSAAAKLLGMEEA